MSLTIKNIGFNKWQKFKEGKNHLYLLRNGTNKEKKDAENCILKKTLLLSQVFIEFPLSRVRLKQAQLTD